MNLIAACRVLVEVEERGSVTRAAASLRIAQSVASRRILALEAHFGAPVLERSARSAVLTPFGRAVAPAARRLVRLAGEVELAAERARLQPLSLAVPATCGTRDLAVLDAAARSSGIRLELRRAHPAERGALLADRVVRVAALAVPPSEARWRIDLGLGTRRPIDRVVRLDELRIARGRARRPDRLPGARIRIGPEDDVPHVRDPLLRAGFGAGLGRDQLVVESSDTGALAGVLADGDLLLCGAVEAAQLGLHWTPIAGLDLARGYALASESAHDARSVEQAVASELGAALGG